MIQTKLNSLSDLHLTYAEGRNQIKTGDMLGIQTGTTGGAIIQIGQIVAGVPYDYVTHCAIAVWVNSRLLVVEMNPGGNLLKPLSQYAGKRMVVCSPPEGTDLSQFDRGLDKLIEHHIPYGILDLIRIGLRLILQRLIDTRRWGSDDEQNKVCSLLPSMIYQSLGGDIKSIPTLASPAEVVAGLSVRFEIDK